MEHSNIENAYEALKEEVRTFRNLVLSKLPDNEIAKSFYKGCDILYSSLHEGPFFLFIGINPGAGYYNTTGVITKDWELDPCDGFEYLNAINEYDYTLAKQTRELFDKAGFYNYLEVAVKTNFFYFHSSKASDLFELYSSLGEEINRQFHANAQKWTRDMINMIKPKVIICEGIDVLKRVSELYDRDPIREGSCGYFELDGCILVLGYSRRYSHILNLPQTAAFIKMKIEQKFGK